MPTDKEILGFSNRWYPEAMRDAQTVALPSGRAIRLISPPLLLATKIEAFYDRGGGDFGASHDIEDIINLIDGRPELVKEIDSAALDVRNYLREEFDDLLAAFADVIAWHLGPQPEDQARVEIVIQRMRTITGL
jgi:predicted nucleotidyltransferase